MNKSVTQGFLIANKQSEFTRKLLNKLKYLPLALFFFCYGKF